MTIRVGGIVLCGGHSRRMGKPKAWLPMGDEHLLQRVVRIVGGVVRPVVVAGRSGQSLPPLPHDVQLVYDQITDGGPLAGLAAGFDAFAGRCDAAFVSSCDHPLIRPQFITRLIQLLGDDVGIIPEHEDHTYPLIAVYRLSTRPALLETLAQSQRRVRAFTDRCGARLVAAEDLLSVDPDLRSLRNVNDPSAYAKVLETLEDQSG